MREVYDPEIPVNIYELGLIYKIEITDQDDGTANVFVEMTLDITRMPCGAGNARNGAGQFSPSKVLVMWMLKLYGTQHGTRELYG